MKLGASKAALFFMALSVVFIALEGENLAGSYDKELELGRKRSEPIVDELIKKMPERAEEIRMHNDVLWSRETEKAREAIKYFAKLKAGNLVALALGHPCDVVKAQAASSLKELGDKKFVPELVLALKRSNIPVPVGGSEIQILRNKLKQALVDALASLPGQDFSDALAYLKAKAKEVHDAVDPEGVKKIDAVIAQCEKWLEEQKRKEKE